MSVLNAFRSLSVPAEIVRASEGFGLFSHLVLPGVGSFPTGMDAMEQKGFVKPFLGFAQQGKPILGICLGMQLLALSSKEITHTKGLGLVEGVIERIEVPDSTYRIPHVGWNEVVQTRYSLLWQGIQQKSSFYFVHGYSYRLLHQDAMIGVCHYGEKIVAALQQNNIFGVQFHPEKSQHAGLQLLNNFVTAC